jgi:hypothetical protein
VTTLPRCTMAGCPVRWHDGSDRPCTDHQNEIVSAARELGIDLPGIYGTQPPADNDDLKTFEGRSGNSATTPHALFKNLSPVKTGGT